MSIAGHDISIQSRTAGFIPGISASSPDGLPLSPSLTQSGQSQNFDRLLQKVEPIGAPPPSPSIQSQTVSSAAAHQTSGQEFGTEFNAAGLVTTPLEAQNRAPITGNIDTDTDTPSTNRDYNQRTAGLSVGRAEGDASLSFSQSEGTSNNRFSFWDLIDIINPLQHLPIISTAYQAITGDEISNISRVVGGAVYGGPVGAGFGLANAAVNTFTGRDIGENALAFVAPNLAPRAEDPPIQIVQNTNDITSSQAEQSFAAQYNPNTYHTNISQNDILWSQDKTENQALPTASPPPPRLDEIIWAGPRVNDVLPSSPSPHRTVDDAARQNLRLVPNLPDGQVPTFLSAIPVTHSTYPIQGQPDENAYVAQHSYTSPDKHTQGTLPATSVALSEGERNREEIPYAGQETVGSPVFLNLQEASADYEGPNNTPEPIAHHEIPSRIIEALDKYQALKLQQSTASPAL